MTVGRITNGGMSLTKQNFSRGDVRSALGERGFRVSVFRWTVSILSNMPVDQYNHMLCLLDRIHQYISEGLRYDFPANLILPWAKNLRGVKIERIVENERALKEVFARCVELSDGVTVDLTILPWIYKSFAAPSSFPA